MADQKIEPSSPYYLGTGDQPRNIISHFVLKGDNYVSWARALTLSLKARRKFGFVDGTISNPTDSTKLLNWETVNSMLVSWILRTLDPKVAASLPFHDSAQALWLYLQKRYCVANGPRLQQLRANITDCRQTKSMTVEDYFTKIMALYDDLERLKPLHTCSCGLCTCNVVDKFRQDREEERLHQFLIGIDDDYYAAVRTNLLSQTPPPDIDRAYQAFLQEERSRIIARTKVVTDETHVFALSDVRERGRIDKSKLVCLYCKKRGHDKPSCFELHGYPQWWLERQRALKPANSCPTGASRGDSATAGAGRGRGSGARAHAVTDTTPGAVSSDGILPATTTNTTGATVAPSSSHSLLATLSPDQVHAILNVINSEKSSSDCMIGKSPFIDWIIDSGASHHVTGDYGCLFDVTHIDAWTVGLPDGRCVPATKSG
ncbi:Retrovirus-related Pol polyprotein from transposon RE1 [Bienertia sinuspersici]